MWIVASLPLWIAGAFAFLIGAVGGVKALRGQKVGTASPGEAIAFSFGALLAAGALLYLAAKVAS